MLEVDYHLSRKEGNFQRQFTIDPKLATIDGNALYVKAPNAKGKSTFLNIIALALYGNKLEDSDCRISETLRSKIRYMASRENQDYTFKLSITSKDSSIKLISSKENPLSNDITIKEIVNNNETYLPFQTFKEKYFLVYDIPEDPLNRVGEILEEVKNQQNRYHNKVSQFRNYLGEVKVEIAQSRNEKEIELLKSTVKNYETEEQSLNANLNEQLDVINILESYLAVREFEKYTQNAVYLMQAIEEENRKKIVNRTNAKRFNTQYENKRNAIKENISIINVSVSNLSYNLESLFLNRNLEDIKQHLKNVNNIDFDEILKTCIIESNIQSELTYFKKQINGYLSDKEIRESGKKGSFYQDLIHIFEQYKSVEISLPGFEKRMDEFVALLKEEYGKNRVLKSIYDDLQKNLKQISDIESNLSTLNKDVQSLKVLSNKKTKSNTKNNEEDIDSNIEQINYDLQMLLKKQKEYKELAERHNIYIDESIDPTEIRKIHEEILQHNTKYSNIFMLSEEHYLKELESLHNELNKTEEKNLRVSTLKKQSEERLQMLESKELHKYYNNSTQIDQLSKVIDSLDQNLTKYDSIIYKISKGEKLSLESEIQYNEAISSYFANKIPEFPYIDEFLKPTKIDFSNKSILLEDGREIDMKDISTGQSMSMYIQAILNRPVDDKRKMIVIFDEGATMDSNSLKPIQTTLSKLIEQNKILLAVFAKAIDDDLTIEQLY